MSLTEKSHLKLWYVKSLLNIQDTNNIMKFIKVKVKTQENVIY